MQPLHRFKDWTGQTLWVGTHASELLHVTIKHIMATSPKWWHWRLSVWKFFQKLQDATEFLPATCCTCGKTLRCGESPRETSLCQSTEYKNHPMWRKEQRFNIQVCTVSPGPWTWLASIGPPSIDREEKWDSQLDTNAESASHREEVDVSWNPSPSSTIKSFWRKQKHTDVYERMMNCSFALRHTVIAWVQ